MLELKFTMSTRFAKTGNNAIYQSIYFLTAGDLSARQIFPSVLDCLDVGSMKILWLTFDQFPLTKEDLLATLKKLASDLFIVKVDATELKVSMD